MSLISVEGLDELRAIFRRAEQTVEREGKSWLRDMGNYGVKQAQINILNVGAVDTNELIQGMHYEYKRGASFQSVTIRPNDEADKYAIYVEEGTRPHWPPRDALQGWADRHNIPVFLVQRAIARKGTEPRKMFERTFEDVDKETNNELRRLVNNIMRHIE